MLSLRFFVSPSAMATTRSWKISLDWSLHSWLVDKIQQAWELLVEKKYSVAGNICYNDNICMLVYKHRSVRYWAGASNLLQSLYLLQRKCDDYKYNVTRAYVCLYAWADAWTCHLPLPSHKQLKHPGSMRAAREHSAKRHILISLALGTQMSSVSTLTFRHIKKTPQSACCDAGSHL